MKDSEIVKALKCCSSLAVGHCTPDDCPYYNIEHCSDQLRLDAANRVEKLSDIYATVCTKWDSEEAMVQESHSSTISIKGALRRFWLRAELAKRGDETARILHDLGEERRKSQEMRRYFCTMRCSGEKCEACHYSYEP